MERGESRETDTEMQNGRDREKRERRKGEEKKKGREEGRQGGNTQSYSLT